MHSLLVEWLGVNVAYCVVKLLGGIGWCRCSALPESGRLARAADLGRSCQAAWQGRWLHLAVKLLGGRVDIVSWCRQAVWWH